MKPDTALALIAASYLTLATALTVAITRTIRKATP
jgi:hypothetical protein